MISPLRSPARASDIIDHFGEDLPSVVYLRYAIGIPVLLRRSVLIPRFYRLCESWHARCAMEPLRWDPCLPTRSILTTARCLT